MHPTSRRRLVLRTLLLLGGVLLLGTPSAHADWGVSGPMVGHVTPTTATIWVYAGARAKVLVKYRREIDPVDEPRVVEMPRYQGGPGTCRVTLTKLQPATKHIFSLLVNGWYEPRWHGSFTTPPLAGTPSKFRVALTSCMEHDDPDHSAFDALGRQKPAFLVLLGDNVYADTSNRSKIWREHLRMRRVPGFAKLIRTMPVWAIWDDHDFGIDNSDGTQVGKDQSLLAFQELFPNPSFGLPDVPGVFFSFRWGQVEFFMLDVRYHRTPNRSPDCPSKQMLGPGQLRWLVNGLAASQARFKVIASGSALSENQDDGWAAFGHAKRRLYHAIRDRGIDGILFFTGDIHRSEIHVHPKSETGFYDLTEVISSGIAVGGPHNFATVDFDTTAADPTFVARIVEKDGTQGATRTVQLSSLTRSPRKADR